MNYIQILGLSAALFTTVSNIPQALKIIKTKETKSVSTSSYVALLFGLVLWVVYGFMRDDLPIIISNIISAVITAVVLFLNLTSKEILENIHDKVHNDGEATSGE
ncbi:MAG TPA: SemiSWEET transporter [Flavobacterium sp.]|nr:SemiSWEET transporter [Flavobacterium sp.]